MEMPRLTPSGGALGTFLGMLGVVAGVLLISVGIAAWGVRIGIIQAYAKMGLIPEDGLNEDKD